MSPPQARALFEEQRIPVLASFRQSPFETMPLDGHTHCSETLDLHVYIVVLDDVHNYNNEQFIRTVQVQVLCVAVGVFCIILGIFLLTDQLL